MAGELEDLSRRWDSYWNEMVVNLGNLPLTIHWYVIFISRVALSYIAFRSLEQGLIKNNAWVGVFGLIAALASFRSGWKATALPRAAAPTAPDGQTVDRELIDPAAPPVGYDASP